MRAYYCRTEYVHNNVYGNAYDNNAVFGRNEMEIFFADAHSHYHCRTVVDNCRAVRLTALLAFIDPWASPKDEGYQLIQSLYALGSGGWFGVGLFNSRQKYRFLPFAESDFVFSVIGEETGLIGCLIIFLLYAVVILRGVKIAVNSKDKFTCYLSGGISAVVAVQSLLNFAVVTGSIPPTGLPLPFISYGGTALV